MNIEIRKATKDDAAAIEKIAIAAWNHTHVPNIDQEQVDYMLERIYTVDALHKAMDENEVFLIISGISDGQNEFKPAGYLSYIMKTEELYFINKLYIHPVSHCKGFGTALLDEAVRILKSLKVKTIQLHVNENNFKAIKFYEKYGFKALQLDHYPFEKYIIHDYLMELGLG